jgi:hypothetical protein
MQEEKLLTAFSEAARAVGAEVSIVAGVEAVVDYVKQLATGSVIVPDFASAKRQPESRWCKTISARERPLPQSG